MLIAVIILYCLLVIKIIIDSVHYAFINATLNSILDMMVEDHTNYDELIGKLERLKSIYYPGVPIEFKKHIPCFLKSKSKC